MSVQSAMCKMLKIQRTWAKSLHCFPQVTSASPRGLSKELFTTGASYYKMNVREKGVARTFKKNMVEHLHNSTAIPCKFMWFPIKHLQCKHSLVCMSSMVVGEGGEWKWGGGGRKNKAEIEDGMNMAVIGTKYFGNRHKLCHTSW